MSTILEGLNPQQKEAVSYMEGPLLVLAGAGSGKTRVITRRIAYLLEQNIARPFNIFGVTFTNKASREMKERIEKLVGGIHMPWIGTFHSMCARILRREIGAIGRQSDFSILGTSEQKSIIKECMREYNIDEKETTPNRVLRSISFAKVQLKKPDDLKRTAHGRYPTLVADMYDEYETKLRQHNALDFDDLITKTVMILQENPDILEKYQNQFTHVLVDEYQDVNHAQYMLAKLLAEKSGNICVVGDDDQSIYGFRGADVSIILKFEQDFRNAKVVKLEENYRSTNVILAAANNIVKQNRNRKSKKLWTQKSGGEKITLMSKLDSRGEAQYIANEIKDRLKKGMRPKDIAVLYRTNAQSRGIEEVLMQQGIDYEIVGGIRFYERAEIKDIISYLKLILNHRDYISFKRVINNPSRGIGSVTRNKIIEESVKKDVDLLKIMKNASTLPRVGKKIQETLSDFADTIELLSEERTKLKTSHFIKMVMEEVGYREMIKNQKDARMNEILDNLDELINDAKEFELTREDSSLEAYLEKVALFADIDEKNKTTPPLRIEDVKDWNKLLDLLKNHKTQEQKQIWSLLNESLKKLIKKWEPGTEPDLKLKESLKNGINTILIERDFYLADKFRKVKLCREAEEMRKRGLENLDDDDIELFNRLVLESIYDDSIEKIPSKIVMMTLHSAKGLEFPVVFMTGLEEGVLPHIRCLIEGKESQIEEERRLFYVGVTRAISKLYITYARERVVQGKTHNQSPSRFLLNIPEDLIDRYVPEVSKRSFIRKVSPILKRHKHTEQKATKYSAGDFVYHKIFGKGEVQNYKNGYVTATFPGVGKKTLAENFLSPSDTAGKNFKPGDKVVIDPGQKGIIKKLDGNFVYVIVNGADVKKVEKEKVKAQ